MEENEIIIEQVEENETIEENNEEVVEEISEEITEEVPAMEDENDILIEYIKQQIEKEKEEEQTQNDENDISIDANDLRSGSDIQSVDPVLSDIYDEVTILSGYIEEYNRDNTLQSDINDISLSNQLTILLFISILFTAVLNFSRRIF